MAERYRLIVTYIHDDKFIAGVAVREGRILQKLVNFIEARLGVFPSRFHRVKFFHEFEVFPLPVLFGQYFVIHLLISQGYKNPSSLTGSGFSSWL
jgi:hypothetical protein